MSQPGFDLTEERRKRAAAGQAERFGDDDIYPGVRPALNALREGRLWLGLAGNQTVSAGRILRELDLPVDMVVTSDDWGVSKPDLAFFEHALETVPYAAEEILYVGGRLDNDIKPAPEAGMATALIRRGPWGVIQEHEPEADEIATIRISSLAELPEWVADLNHRDQ